ncbi:hypothetical protein SSTU70S_05950 [Stutzerimonas stutzeri]
MGGQGEQARCQSLQLRVDFALALLRLAQLRAEGDVAVTQFLQTLILFLQNLACALGLAVIVAVEAGDQRIGLVPGMLAAAADRAWFARDQCRAQRLDILAARQALAFEQGEGDLERLLGGVALAADLFAQRHEAVQFGLLATVGVGQFALAGDEAELLRPELVQRIGFALGLAPIVELAMQMGQLFGQADLAVAFALQGVQRLALLGFGCLGLRLQRGEFALTLLQPRRQLHGLLQPWPVTAPGGTERLQRCARFELSGQRRELFGGVLLLCVELLEGCLAGAGRGIGLGAFFADRGKVGVQMAEAFLFAACLRQPRLGCLPRLFG